MSYAPYLFAAIVALAGGAFRGFAGFGSGLLMVPLVTLVFDPKVAVPAMVLVALMGDVRLLPEVRREVNVRRVLSIGAPALLCLPLGIAMLAFVDPVVLRRVISGAIVVLVALLAMGARFRSADRLGVLVPVGGVSGVLTGVAGIGGPPVVLTFLSLNEPATQMRANLIAYFSMTGLAALVMMLLAGISPAMEVLPLFAAIAPCFLLSLHFGAKAFHASTKDHYRRTAMGFLIFVALLGLVWPGP